MENNNYTYNSKENIKNNTPNKKRKIASFALLVILTTILFCAFNITKKIISEPSGVRSLPLSIHTALSLANGKITNYDAPDTPGDLDDVFVLYQNLSDADKNVYNIFMDLVENRADKEYTNAVVISKDTLDEFGEDRLIWDIYYAMCYDHPEYFFLLTDSTAINYFTIEKGDYAMYFFSMEVVDPIETEQITELEEAATAFLKDIDLNGSDEEIELAIHDKLIDTVAYDDAILDSTEESWDLGHTAYGALVHDSEGRPNHAVCAGYSFAFEYLLHEAGIPCGYVAGTAESMPPADHDNSTHAWNVVQISGKWYEVDTTWDDAEYDISEDPYFYNALLSDKEKYYNVRHHFYNRTTAEMENLKATDATLFYIEGYEPYNDIDDTSHVRANFSGSPEKEFDAFVNSLNPIAE